jgi:hypothetical protein
LKKMRWKATSTASASQTTMVAVVQLEISCIAVTRSLAESESERQKFGIAKMQCDRIISQISVACLFFRCFWMCEGWVLRDESCIGKCSKEQLNFDTVRYVSRPDHQTRILTDRLTAKEKLDL